MKHVTILLAAITVTMALSCRKEIQKTGVQSSAVTSLSSTDDVGDVYTMSNALDDNKVYHYNRASDGTLTLEGKYRTSGIGSGTSLFSQGSVMLSDDKNWLFVVNASSNEISVFNVSTKIPQLVNKVSSHGQGPISIAVHSSWLYVLNAGSDFKGSIAGFTIGTDGTLTYIENSKKRLSPDEITNAAQISFNNDGTVLIITERTTNDIVTYTLDAEGIPSHKKIIRAAAVEPFGFALDNADHIYLSGASRGVEDKSTVSSYSLDNKGNVTKADVLNRTFQTASCWLVLTNDFKYAYVTNTGSNTISGFSVQNGSLNLLNSNGVTAATGLEPQDEAISSDSKYLYVLNQGDKTIGVYSINASTGALSKIGEVGDLHHKSQGLAAK